MLPWSFVEMEEPGEQVESEGDALSSQDVAPHRQKDMATNEEQKLHDIYKLNQYHLIIRMSAPSEGGLRVCIYKIK